MLLLCAAIVSEVPSADGHNSYGFTAQSAPARPQAIAAARASLVSFAITPAARSFGHEDAHNHAGAGHDYRRRRDQP